VNALDEKREGEEAASPWRERDHWLAASQPIAVDDDPDWPNDLRPLHPDDERAAA
jgi:hypothetical protein